ncbi:MAG: DinB family protein [Gemmatimonadales bacterium]
MPAESFPRPGDDEYAPFYAGYISGVPDGDLLETLTHQLDEMLVLCGSLVEAQGDLAYAEGKWTIKEVIGHMNDAERIFAYRALRIARGDATPLPGFDENAYTPESGAAGRTLADLAEEFATVRRATLSLLASLTPDAAARRGTASNQPASARAIAWTIAGHAGHHLRILRERYLGQ